MIKIPIQSVLFLYGEQQNRKCFRVRIHKLVYLWGKLCSLFQVNKHLALYTFPLLVLGDFPSERLQSYLSLKVL